MSREADKHIRVTEETWLELNKQKRPGDSFDDVLQRLLEEHEETAESSM
jgi:predicted CopG family antitoxin